MTGVLLMVSSCLFSFGVDEVHNDTRHMKWLSLDALRRCKSQPSPRNLLPTTEWESVQQLRYRQGELSGHDLLKRMQVASSGYSCLFGMR